MVKCDGKNCKSDRTELVCHNRLFLERFLSNTRTSSLQTHFVP